MVNTQLTLSELNSLIRDTLEEAFPSLIWVKAEISDFTVNRNGHCYLELVDTDPVSAQVTARARATIWSYTFRMMKPYFETTTGQAFSNGLKVLVSAKVEFHPLYGLSLNIRDIDPAYTMGDMARKRREIILRLQRDGVFEMNKELELPVVPQRIAVISSPSAAGLQDFMDQLSRNPAGICFYTRLFPATMQGTETAASIIGALEQIFQFEGDFDVVVIIRGGGAQLDLASFDHYELAYHVAQFPIPVITGIGHDKDETIVDLVAHTKMKTPTAVAGFLISGAETFEQKLAEAGVYCSRLLNERVRKENDSLQMAVGRLKQGLGQLVKKEEYRFSLTGLRLKSLVPSVLQRGENRLVAHSHRLQLKGRELLGDEVHVCRRKAADLQVLVRQFMDTRERQVLQIWEGIRVKLPERLKTQQNKLDVACDKVRLVDPLQVLKRGYSLTYQQGRLVRSVRDLKKDDELVTRLPDGEVKSSVGEMAPRKDH